MITTFKCPHCGEIIAISDALRGQLEEELLASEKRKHQKEIEQMKSQAAASMQKEIKQLEDAMSEKNKLLDQARNNEITLRKEKIKLEDDRRAFELEKLRQIDLEREKIREKTFAEVSEKYRLKDREYEVKIESLKKSLEDAQRKASQGSQQLQGEVQEIDFEQMLHTAFPQDAIEPIGKGVLGADIRQVVKSPLGMVCGTILWESKRTKAWSDGWISKLKQDVLRDKAHIAAIVSDTLPQEAKHGMGQKDGVWIAQPDLALTLSMLLRKGLLDTAKQKKIAEAGRTKAEDLYVFVTSHDFQHQIEAIMTIYFEMRDSIQKERTAYERIWKQRESQVNRLITGVSGIYGSMQGIAGSALPDIKELSLPEGDHS